MKAAERRIYDFLNNANDSREDDIWGLELTEIDGTQIYEWWSFSHECFCALLVIKGLPEPQDIRKIRARFHRHRADSKRKFIQTLMQQGQSHKEATQDLYCFPLYVGVLCPELDTMQGELTVEMLENDSE